MEKARRLDTHGGIYSFKVKPFPPVMVNKVRDYIPVICILILSFIFFKNYSLQIVKYNLMLYEFEEG